MQVSLNIILDALLAYRLEIHAPTAGRAFSMCLPLPDDCGTLQKDCIYIGTLTKALAIPGPDISCICLRDRKKDSLETESGLSGLIIVNDDITQTVLFSLVQNRFFEIINWVHKLQEALIHDGSMQEIVDLCAPVIDNYIDVTDSSMMLLAYSKLVPCDDPICNALVSHGYYPEDIIQLFRKYDVFKVWENAETPYMDNSCEVAKYPTYHKIFKFGSTYFAHAVLTCNKSPLTPSMIDRFSIFIEVLSVYIDRAWAEKNTCNHLYDTFLTELIEGSITSRSIIEERAQYVGFPLTGQFSLFQIVPNDTATVSIGKMVLEFNDLFPRVKFVRYQQRIIAVNHFYSRDVEEQMKDICSKLEPFLEKNDAICGVSPYFDTLEETAFSYKQSSLALKYVNRLRGSSLLKNSNLRGAKDSRIYFYNHNYIFCLLGEIEHNMELWYHCCFHGLFKKLYLYDQKHRSNNLQLLYVFLSCERNATKAADTLNMHRNNVTYHINRIQEMLGLDLDDSTLRYTLLISFSLLELYGFSDS